MKNEEIFENRHHGELNHDHKLVHRPQYSKTNIAYNQLGKTRNMTYWWECIECTYAEVCIRTEFLRLKWWKFWKKFNRKPTRYRHDDYCASGKEQRCDL